MAFKHGTTIKIKLLPSDLATVWRVIGQYGETFGHNYSLEEFAYQSMATYVRLLAEEIKRATPVPPQEEQATDGAESESTESEGNTAEEAPLEAADTGALANSAEGSTEAAGVTD